MMTYFVFRSIPGRAHAVTDDPNGMKLPTPPEGVWALEKGAPHIVQGGGIHLGAPCDHIIAAIQANGYYVWPRSIVHLMSVGVPAEEVVAETPVEPIALSASPEKAQFRPKPKARTTNGVSKPKTKTKPAAESQAPASM